MDDGIADQLAGPVVGDQATAGGPMDVNAARGKLSFRQEDVRRGAATAEGDDRRVLDQEQGVGYIAKQARRNQLVLNGQRFAIGQPPEVENSQAVTGWRDGVC